MASAAVEKATCALWRTSGRALRPLRGRDDVAGRQRAARELASSLVQAPPVVGQIDLDRGRPGGDDAEHVAFVNQLARDALQEISDPGRVAEIQVQIVDEDEEDAAGLAGGGPRRRHRQTLDRLPRRGGDVVGAAAVRQGKRHERLRHAVLDDLEVPVLEVGDELSLVVANDDVGGHEIDARREVGPPLFLRLAGAARERQERANGRPPQLAGSCVDSRVHGASDAGMRRMAGGVRPVSDPCLTRV